MAEQNVPAQVRLDNCDGFTRVRGVHETNEQRHLNLLIKRSGDRYRLCVQACPGLEPAFPSGLGESDIELTPAALWGSVQRVRAEWRRRVIDARRGNEFVFQRAWDFSTDPSLIRECLPALAVAGMDLFNDIFFPSRSLAQPEAYRALTAMGEALRDLSGSNRLLMRVTSDEFYAPWNLIYSKPLKDMKDGSDAVPEGFWGYAHMVEHVPERAMRGTDLGVDQPVRASLFLDTSIDSALQVDCNKVLEAELANYGTDALSLARSTTSREMMDTLGLSLDQHILYFCCHASVDGDGTRINIDDAYLTLTDRDFRIAPSRLNGWLGRNLFKNGPVVFLNACQTGQMNSLFYQGFVPAFMDRQASALIGTQTEIPAIFAGQFARQFFARFFAGGTGNTAGRVLFDLRRAFFDEFNNPLGLLYSIYRGADVHLLNAVPPRPTTSAVPSS